MSKNCILNNKKHLFFGFAEKIFSGIEYLGKTFSVVDMQHYQFFLATLEALHSTPLSHRF